MIGCAALPTLQLTITFDAPRSSASGLPLGCSHASARNRLAMTLPTRMIPLPCRPTQRPSSSRQGCQMHRQMQPAARPPVRFGARCRALAPKGSCSVPRTITAMHKLGVHNV